MPSTSPARGSRSNAALIVVSTRDRLHRRNGGAALTARDAPRPRQQGTGHPGWARSGNVVAGVFEVLGWLLIRLTPVLENRSSPSPYLHTRQHADRSRRRSAVRRGGVCQVRQRPSRSAPRISGCVGVSHGHRLLRWCVGRKSWTPVCGSGCGPQADSLGGVRADPPAGRWWASEGMSPVAWPGSVRELGAASVDRDPLQRRELVQGPVAVETAETGLPLAAERQVRLVGDGRLVDVDHAGVDTFG